MRGKRTATHPFSCTLVAVGVLVDFFRLISTRPLIAKSFSSCRCEIDPNDGAIKSKACLKQAE